MLLTLFPITNILFRGFFSMTIDSFRILTKNKCVHPHLVEIQTLFFYIARD